MRQMLTQAQTAGQYFTNDQIKEMNRKVSAVFFNDTATTEIYTLSLHDALPISIHTVQAFGDVQLHVEWATPANPPDSTWSWTSPRSEEHTSELQSRLHLVCRLLLEKKKIFPSNSRFPRLCAKCLLKLKRLVSILPMTKSKK